MRRKRFIAALGGSLLTAGLGGCSGAAPDPDIACHVGAYRLSDGRIVVITPRPGDELRYTLVSGETAALRAEDPPGRFTVAAENRDLGVSAVTFPSCDGAGLQLHGDAAEVSGTRLDLEVHEEIFSSGDIELFGRLVLPDGPTSAVAVLVHGSEDYSATLFDRNQHLLPALGVGVFVYDKRGTGRSGGDYTQDFDVLADDAVNAYHAARRLLGDANLPVGYVGASQGGRVAPLTASRSDATFVVAAYGMMEGPLAEDREEVLNGLRNAGYGDAALAAAREIAEATGRVMASRFRDGFAELAEVKARYRDEPWFDAIEGEYTPDMLTYPGWVLRVMGPLYDRGTSWGYEPLPTVRNLDARQLWVLAGQDDEAPSATTVQILRALQDAGATIDVAVFPNTDHGIFEFETLPDGSRRYTRIADGYFRLIADWISSGALPPATDTLQIYPRRLAQR